MVKHALSDESQEHKAERNTEAQQWHMETDQAGLSMQGIAPYKDTEHDKSHNNHPTP